MVREISIDEDTTLIIDRLPPQRPTLEREVETLRTAFRTETLRILVTPNVRAYLAVLQRLRLAKKHENGDVAHEELYETVRDTLRKLTGDEIDPHTFVDRIQELHKAELILREWEPRSDQSINSFLWDYHRYRISDEAGRLLAMLERAARAQGRRPSTIEARHNLRIIREKLASIHDQTRTLYTDPDTGSEARRQKAQAAYQDLARLFRQEFTEFRDFLSDLNQLLHEYGRNANPTSFEALDQLIRRLEAYVEEMLLFVQINSEAIHKTATDLHVSALSALEVGHAIETGQSTDPLTLEAPTSDTHPDPETVLNAIGAYFGDPGPGTLDEAIRRIREATISTVKRLREHYERLLQRTHFGEYLKLRISETAVLTPTDERFDAVVGWANRLFHPRSQPTAPRMGTPDEPGQPLLPHKQYQYQKPPLLGVKAKKPASNPPEITLDHKKLVTRLDEFVHTRILQGNDAAQLRELDLATFQDFRTLIEVIKQSNLIIAGPVSEEVSFSIEDPRKRPVDPLSLTQWTTPEGRFTAPDLTFKKKTPANAWDRRKRS